MAILQITPSREEEQDKHFEDVARANEGKANFVEEAFTPVVLMDLRDELTRSRLREAAWISIIAHLVAIIFLSLSPKWMPNLWGHPVKVVEDRLRDKDTTFLALPPDAQKLVQKPHTNVLSDKDRVATSHNPDPKELKKLLDQRQPGPPAHPAAQPSVPAPPQMAQQQQQSPQQQNPATQQGQQTAMNNPPQFESPNMQPKMTLPKAQPSFGAVAMSAGSAIQQAARASSGSAGKLAVGGGMGLGRGPTGGQVRDAMEITTDTQGVDFGPYLARIKQTIEANWYTAMPESVYPPLRKSGKVAVEFVILPDGKVQGMRIFFPSGDVALDRAAWGGISASNPFPPLPKEFHGPYLGLRCYFLYNPTTKDLEQ
ncbi:TonB-like protein [Candidatus Koribacter versatilis Ellin345]|uniref:TonB-like protein n=1 Tax=Koribacter versatilis (strain Ellin345) TaxID=204669 RepID=Q1IHU5_KORVE|nr:TonB family protein [Candidatus Koribacter versatilis]ABF43555.1 TonB-like protein [Candidatus Koribacter versatilis Ellin345]